MKIKSLGIKRLRWWIVITAVILVKAFSLNKGWVEHLYARGLYPLIARFFRLMFGWIPLSFGDLLYFLAGAWLLYRFLRFLVLAFKGKMKAASLKRSMGNGIFYLLIIYLVFNLAWGLNYNRQGIAKQLDLNFKRYDSTELKQLTYLLLARVNSTKEAWLKEDQPYPNDTELFRRSKQLYEHANPLYPFLELATSSIKSSMFSLMGNYFGFTGYYNPFTGEAQVNTSVPEFIRPFTTAHELAHQVGYAKENEASFVAYLCIESSTDQLFRYSCYLDMFMFAHRELYFLDSSEARHISNYLKPEVVADIKEWREFSKKFKNPFEPIVRWAYGQFLKINDQPQGILTYNEVLGNLIAFYRKFGRL